MKKFKVYNQQICNDCLQLLVNGESDHTEKELNTFNKTLLGWSKLNYFPAGLSDNEEGYFSHRNCDICGQIAGQRNDYNFFQK